MSKKVLYMVSLGCAKNLVDTEVMAGQLVTNGYLLSFDERDASVYLVNTCAFLPAARSESETAILDAIRWKKKKTGRRVVVAGCINEKLRNGEAKYRLPEDEIYLRYYPNP
ncbi:MAG: hypothetical protein AB7F32_08110 [Victivallaceae bacterium]